MKKVFTIIAAFIIMAATAHFSGTKTAEAGQCVGINCNQPTAVKRGQKVPVWKVGYCIIGNPGNYKKINCKSPRAVHQAPTGNLAVCFVGTDGKVHWDYQREVHVGRPFINLRIGGRWQPDWQSPRPY